MNKIHLIGGEKGGVGKSVVARLLAQYCIDRKIPFSGYDADLSHGAMIRYYKDFSTDIDITRFDQADTIIEQTIESEGNAIVDLAAQTVRPVKKWIEETGIIDLANEVGLELNFWHVMDDGSDSLKLLHELMDSYGKQTNYVVVRNFGRGKDFSHLQAASIADRINELKVDIIDLPALHQPTMHKIDHISASFWAAANNKDKTIGPTLKLLERQRVKIWLQKAYEQLDKIHALPDSTDP